MTKNQKKIARILLDIGAIKFGNFKLKLHETNPEAPLSPIYINLRLLRSFPEVLRSVVIEMVELIKQDCIKYDLLADLPTAATPIATLLMDRTNIPMISPRKDAKAYGLAVKIDGVFSPTQRVLMVDDIVTMADTKIGGAKILREAGLVVEDVIVIIDRMQGGREELKKDNINLHAVFGLPEIIEYYRRDGLISQERFDSVKTYLGF